MYREIFKKYLLEIKDSLKIDELSIGEFTMKVPAEKHAWNQRLSEHKLELLELERKKKHILKELHKKTESESPVKVSSALLVRSLEETDIIKTMNENIEDLKELIEFLERNFRTMSNLHMDVKNILEEIKARTM